MIDAAAIVELRGRLRGRIILPGDEFYEPRRKVWNGMIDRRPALIVECTGTADVVAAVSFARDRNLPISVRGGGHNVAGTAVIENGVVIDLSRMDGVWVDPEQRIARAGGGATLGVLDHETQLFGLATPVGVVSRTGVAGLCLHGGLGFLTRKYGLTCDNLTAADVVTADGRVLRADRHNHPDLLWALRGGGGNFGAVTSFEFRLHPVGPEVWAAIVMYPVEQAASIMRFYREFMAEAPEELMSLAIFWTTPGEEPVPEPARRQPALILFGCYSGPLDEGEQAVQPLRDAGTPLVDLSGRYPFTAVQQLFDPDYPDGRRYYWKSLYLRSLDEEVVAALADHASRRPSPLSSLDVWTLGGAMRHVPEGGSAFEHRDAPYLLGIEANWDDPADDAANLGWAREVFRDMQTRFPSGGVYLNFPGFLEESASVVGQAYGGEHLARLQEIKTKYDPGNLFRSNFNIRPGG
jgi:FAD/FMN-containing dehydrogenase